MASPRTSPLECSLFLEISLGNWLEGWGVCLIFSRKLFGEYQLVIHPSAIFQPTWGQRLAMLFDFWRGPSNKWSHEISRPTVHWTGYILLHPRNWTNRYQKMICLWENVYRYRYIHIYIYISGFKIFGFYFGSLSKISAGYCFFER